MKKPLTFLAALALVVALAGFVVSPALGGPGFITKKRAGKIYLSKKKAKKIYLTQKAATGRYYTQSQTDAKYPAASGTTRVPVFPTAWFLPAVPAGGSVSANFAYFRIGATQSTPSVDALTPITFPSVLYGQTVTIKGLEICQRFDPGVSVTQIGLWKIPGDATEPTVTTTGLVQTFAQAASIGASGCQTISMPDVPIPASEPAYLSLRFALPANAALRLGRASLIVSAS